VYFWSVRVLLAALGTLWGKKKATPGRQAKARQKGGVASLFHLSFVVTELTAINMPGNDWPARVDFELPARRKAPVKKCTNSLWQTSCSL